MRSRLTICAVVTGVQTCDLPICNSQLIGIALNGWRVDQYTSHRYFNDHAPAKDQLTFPPKADRKFDKAGWSWYGPFLAHSTRGGSVFFLQQPSSWGTVY